MPIERPQRLHNIPSKGIQNSSVCVLEATGAGAPLHVMRA
jgi:hypothetical protein